ncbi:peroxisomal targeting signal receptor [Gaeumannomyces tritici R3-111a-1]|uniref:Peroxisomal targeting signal receptor n=1 Tax=Gaeumannomyces tritici (strain R3-111a-1) TaxID=644352 RepID=J3NSB5_GAET3|nr:peroxisomal targeting signal receptor [Gaeumannomyces tritici R3-111a-1]EJT79072.1 peroxisomal targeting signal receptor [Gaeumannomyces tritici R3-111a-1]
MSFLGGAECSTAGNPLSQLAKHAQDDQSLQRDRLMNRGPRPQDSFRSVTAAGPSSEESFNAFVNTPAQLPDFSFDHGPMGHVHIDPGHAVHMRASSASPHGAWSDEFASHAGPAAAAQAAPFNPAEFAAFQRLNQSGPAASAASPLQQHHQQQQRPLMSTGYSSGMGMGMGVPMGMNMGMGMGMGMGYSSMQRPLYQPMYPQQEQLTQAAQEASVKGKGKEKVVELDDQKWEEHFAQIELEDKQAKQEDESLAMEPELNKLDSELLESETGFGDFESIWNGIQAGNADMEFPRTTDWDLSSGRLGRAPPLEEYLFEEDNIFKDQPNPFDEGMRIMEEGGNLSLAALAFEAAVQANPEHAEAWVQLGSAQAQNEKEDAAIRALEHAIKLDPNNSAALMALAVSYTNEGYDSTSHRTLERWLSAKYPLIAPPDKLSAAADMGFTDRQQLHDRVTDLFLQAARLAPDGQHMDPDVQVGLGVLFYGAEDYTKAVDCFSAALASSEQGTSNQRGQVHLLWNRLGATLANSGRSEDAISAYEKALSIRPNFVRARYNLGVSCINMNCEREAAGHLLAALAMHKEVEKSGRERAREILGGGAISDEHLDRLTTQNRSTTLYDSLRRVFTGMGRRDLADRVVPGVDPESFRGDFDF